MAEEIKKLTLSPSGADTWAVCTASPLFIWEERERIPDDTTVYAQEGNIAHGKAEFALNNYFHDDDFEDPSMREHIRGYVNFVESQLEGEGSQLIVEKKVNLSYMPGRRGFIDAVIINYNDAGYPCYVGITDLKYGMGVSKQAHKNRQLSLYGGEIVEWFSQEYQKTKDRKWYLAPEVPVKVAIYQPRIAGEPAERVWDTTVEELTAFARGLQDCARGIIENTVELTFVSTEEINKPGEDPCKFCKAKPICKHRDKVMMDSFNIDTDEPLKPQLEEAAKIFDNTLTDAQIAERYEASKEFSKLAATAKDYVFGRLQSPGGFPGYKLVEGRSNRKWTDDAEAEKALSRKFKVDERFNRKLITAPQAEKLIKSKPDLPGSFVGKIKALIIKPKGAPTIAKEDDKRPAYDNNDRAQVFEDESETQETNN